MAKVMRTRRKREGRRRGLKFIEGRSSEKGQQEISGPRVHVPIPSVKHLQLKTHATGRCDSLI